MSVHEGCCSALVELECDCWCHRPSAQITLKAAEALAAAVDGLMDAIATTERIYDAYASLEEDDRDYETVSVEWGSAIRYQERMEATVQLALAEYRRATKGEG